MNKELSSLIQHISPRLLHPLCGEKGLSRFVNNIAIIESPDATQTLTEGELILSSGMFFNQSEDFVIDSITKLSRAGCAGLFIKNLASNQIKSSVIRHANQLNFPIFELESVMSLTEVAKILYRHIYEASQLDFEHVLSVLRQLNNHAMSGTTVDDMVQTMAQQISNTVIFLDAHFMITSIQTVLPKWRKSDLYPGKGQRFFAANEQARIDKGFYDFPASPYQDRILRNGEHLSFILVPARWSDSAIGYLCLLSTNKQFSMMELWIAENFLPIFTQTLHAKGINENSSLKNVEDLFVWQVLLQKNPDTQRTKQFCALCNFDHNATRICMAIEYPTLKSAPSAQRRSTLEKQREFIAKELELYSDMQKLILIHENYLIVLRSVSCSAPRISVVQSHEFLSEKLVQKIDEHFSLDCFIGLSETSKGLDTLSSSYFEAVESITLGKKIRPNRSWFSYHEQYLFHRLWHGFTTSQLHEICMNILEPIMEDAPDFAELRRTLEAYISCTGNLSQTAERLFIHRNTLNYRMAKLKNLLSVNEISADDFTRYMVGLTILKMI